MKKLFNLSFVLLALLFGCISKSEDGKLVKPSDITVSVNSENCEVLLTWKDNASGESGYTVMVASSSYNLLRDPISLPEGTTSCTVADVKSGTYIFGVRADSPQGSAYNSPTLWSKPVQVDVLDPDPDPTPDPDPDPDPDPEPNVPEDEDSPVVITDIFSTATCVSVKYEYKGVKSIKSTGVCWDSRVSPDISLACQGGPTYLASKTSSRQVISNVLLEYGKEYKFRAYVELRDGTYIYSTSATASLGGEPQPITFDWTDVTDSSLPSSVKVYKTEEKLNGRNFNAWYAIADMKKGDVDFKVVRKSKTGDATVADQFAANSECLVLANGGYFYYESGCHHVGILTIDGETSGDVSTVWGYRNTNAKDDPEYDKTYFVTRGTFGVDASGTPGVYWTATGETGWNGNADYMYYERPLPSVVSDPFYRSPTADFPAPKLPWSPKYAVSAGPVLLKDGKCPFDFTTTGGSDHYYLTNYEVIAYDIFGSSLRPDRTAVGYTKDGKIIIFICDGRIDASGGAKLDELAMIMKGLGCVDALNLDGGGSTAMVSAGKQLNYAAGTNDGLRKVYTCVGFFKK